MINEIQTRFSDKVGVQEIEQLNKMICESENNKNLLLQSNLLFQEMSNLIEKVDN